MRRVFCAVRAVAALALSAAPAGAQSVTVARIDIPVADGGAVHRRARRPPGIFDFTSACAGHDLCYAGGVQTQAACDTQFLGDMTALCLTQHLAALDPLRYLCLTFAQIYDAGVRLFGRYFF